MNVKQARKVSLVLGSGGARGITQIGVIKYLLEQGYEIDEVIGCSIGSLVGAAFVSDKLGDLGDWMATLTQNKVFRLMDFSNPRYGLLKGERVLTTLRSIFEDVNIEDMPMRYRAIATDLEKEEEVVFESGSVYAAIRASIAIPGVFKGVMVNERFLVDGGVLNPLPVNYVTHKDNIIVAVNLDGMPTNQVVPVPTLNPVSLLQESYFAMRRKLTMLSLALYPADYVINVPHDASGVWEFHRAAELIEKGYELAKAALETAEPKLIQ